MTPTVDLSLTWSYTPARRTDRNYIRRGGNLFLSLRKHFKWHWGTFLLKMQLKNAAARITSQCKILLVWHFKVGLTRSIFSTKRWNQICCWRSKGRGCKPCSASLHPIWRSGHHGHWGHSGHCLQNCSVSLVSKSSCNAQLCTLCAFTPVQYGVKISNYAPSEQFSMVVHWVTLHSVNPPCGQKGRMLKVRR